MRHPVASFCVILLLFFVFSAHASAATFTVNATTDAVDATPGDGNCATAGAVCTLRAAVQEANALAGDDTINIPAGTFTITIEGTGEDFAATGDIDIRSNLTISGASKTTTILDANSKDRFFHVVGGTYTVAISNMTIKKGSVTNLGGGIYVQPTTDTFSLTNVSFESNSAGTSGQGGGVYSNSPVTGTGLTFTSNTAHGGAGGLYFYGGTSSITNSTFSGNKADPPSGNGWAEGGAVYNDRSALTLTNVTFTGNIAGHGGAMYFNSGSLTGDQLTFTNNNNPDPAYTGWTLGGAIYFNYPGDVTITNSAFTGNRIKNGVGGAIEHEGSGTLSITNTSFTNNYSAGDGGLGDGGGGAINIPTSNVTLNLTKVTLSGNQAKYGGGIFTWASDGTYTNVTVSGNTATSQGGGIFVISKLKNLINSTIANNTAPADSGGGIYDRSGTSTAVYLKNTIIADNTGGDYKIYGASVPNSNGYNICSDTSCNSFLTATGDKTSTGPLLNSLADNGGDIQTISLKYGSPAIDTGTNTGCPATDARETSRPQDGDNNGTATCDIGAYEYIYDPPPIISGISISKTDSAATITWTTNEAGSSQVEYGLTAAYGSSTTETDTGTRVTSHSVTLTGLAVCTTYHFRTKSTDSNGGPGVSSDQSLTTGSCSAPAPNPNQQAGFTEVISAGSSFVGLPTFISNGSQGETTGTVGQILLTSTTTQVDLNIKVQTESFNEVVQNNIIVPWAQGLNTASEFVNFEAKFARKGDPFTSSLDNSATIQLTYDPKRLYGHSPKELRLAYWDSATRTWVVLKNNTVLDPINHRITNHSKFLGYYAVVYPTGGTTSIKKSSSVLPAATSLPETSSLKPPVTKAVSLPIEEPKRCLINLFGIIKLFCR